MAITNDTVKRLSDQTLTPGTGEYVAAATASTAEDATFDLTQFGFKEAPTFKGGIAVSAAGGVTVGVKTVTATSLVVTFSGAGTGYVNFIGKVS